MSSKPSGLKQPSKIGKPAGVVRPTVPTAAVKPNDHDKVDPTPISSALASAIFTSDDLPKRKRISDASVVLTENTDDFIIGDRVWVGGTKPGHIQYIGETQFAPGEWAGVVLDETVGKNDGSVAGVRYFMCEPKRGVFSRLTKLSRDPVQHLIDEEREVDVSISATSHYSAPASTGRNGNTSSGSSSPHTTRAAGGKSSPASSVNNLRKTSPMGSSQNVSAGATDAADFKVGGRITVHSTSGTKPGTLRYLGKSDFATGEWAGIELDDPVGKNDGSVAGRRYFECRMKYGLFAPIHKISKGAPAANAKRASTGAPAPRSASMMTNRRSGSHESLNSSISSASSVARAARVRLGVTSLTSKKAPMTRSPVAPPVQSAHTALQEALKEKEQHIEQLLKERDLERAEVARAAVQVEESERLIGAMKSEKQRYLDDSERQVAKVMEMADNTEKQRKELHNQLEEERRKVEDLQFRIEEETITKSDLESTTEAHSEKIGQLEKLLEEERKRTERLEAECQKLFQSEETIAKLTDDIEQLRNKLNTAENKIRSVETFKDEVESQAIHTVEDLNRKDARLAELEASIDAKDKEASELKKRLRESEGALEDIKFKQVSIQETVDSLSAKLQTSETSSNTASLELEKLQLNFADLERKLQSGDDRNRELMCQKTKLEEDIADLMKTKGSSSEQMSKMHEELRAKERRIEECGAQMQAASQEVARLKDKLAQMEQKCQKDVAELCEVHREEINTLKAQMTNMTSDLERAHSKLQLVSSQHEEDMGGLQRRREEEVTELKHDLHSRDSQICLLTTQLRDIREEVDKLSSSKDDERGSLDQQLREVRLERDRATREKDEIQRKNEDLEERVTELETNRDNLVQQHKDQEVVVSERDAKVTTLTAEVDRLRTEFGNHRLELQRKLAENQLDSQAMQDMHNQMTMQSNLIEELQKQLEESEKAREELQVAVDKVTSLQTHNAQLESSTTTVKLQLEEMKQRESNLKVEHAKQLKTQDEKLGDIHMLVEERHRDVERLQKELLSLRSESSNMETYRTTIQVMDSEKQKLSNQVKELEIALEQKTRSVPTEPILEVLQEERVSAQSQIEFLNSVIVDMQKKNDDLQARIIILEAGPTLMDADDINLNGIKTQVVLPRLFCDICDVFDLHDTEDCPRQASSDSPPPSQHHGTRNDVRPYCNICEVFGHWTNQCNDDEMF